MRSHKTFLMQNRYIVKFCDVNVVAKNWYLETCYVVNVIPHSPQKCITQKVFEMCRPFINVNTLSWIFCYLRITPFYFVEYIVNQQLPISNIYIVYHISIKSLDNWSKVWHCAAMMKECFTFFEQIFDTKLLYNN